MVCHADPAGYAGAGFTADQGIELARKRAFGAKIALEQPGRNGQAQNPVSEKFEPLVISR